jgi:hypothetical protein
MKPIVKFCKGEHVTVVAGSYFWNPKWARANRREEYYTGHGRTELEADTTGTLVRSSPDSGPCYKEVMVNGELLEVERKNLRKIAGNASPNGKQHE